MLRSKSGPLLIVVCALVGCPAPPSVEVDAATPDAGAMDAPGTDGGGVCADPDRDRDGERSLLCGGGDCDDEDPQRTPSRPEFCDPDDRDEDCDPMTFGIRDLDTDDEPDARCCNVEADGTEHCGTDCDDGSASVGHASIEVCNGVNDDCDESTDETVTVPLYPDVDGDGHGTDDSSVMATPGCPGASGFATLRGDCNDRAPGIHNAASEVCNGIDDDCDGITDDVVDMSVFCRFGETSACTTSCGLSGMRTCGADCLSWGACRADETCNACDDDGDGMTDETFACVEGALLPCDVPVCGTAGSRRCLNDSCMLDSCRAPEVCNFCDDDGMNGIADEHALATADAPAVPILGSRYVGGAYENAWDADPMDGVNQNDVYAILLDGTMTDDAGGYWFDLGRHQGWGDTVIEVVLEARVLEGTPMGSWNIMVANGGTAVDLGPASDGGAPSGRTGIRVEWAWTWPDTESSGSPPYDSGNVFRYGAMRPFGTLWRGSSDRNYRLAISTGADLLPASSGWTRQHVRIVYHPEDPGTVTPDERVYVQLGDGPASMSFTPTPAMRYTPMANDLPVGTDPSQRLQIGITAGTYPYTYDEGGSPVTVTGRVEARVHMYRFLVDGADYTETHISTVERHEICPGGF